MFLANMSHELRTPLNAVIGFSEIIAAELLGPVTERYREYAKDIYDSGSHLLSIVNDVLDLAKLQNAPELELTPVHVTSATETALKILKEQAERASVGLEVAAARNEMTVLASEKSLSQIVLNLGSNAIKFSEPGGYVKIAVDQLPQADRIEITVSDQGCGIPPDKLPSLASLSTRSRTPIREKPEPALGWPSSRR